MLTVGKYAIVTLIACEWPVPAQGASLTTLYSITHGKPGTLPSGAVIESNGSLYGVTVAGGAAGHGVVYKMDPVSGATDVLHSFIGGQDGAAPQAALIAVHGALYGTTNVGGTSNKGTVFRIDPITGSETVVYAFTGSADGANPYAALVEYNGALYGATRPDSGNPIGTLFKIDLATGAQTTLQNFSCANEGCLPSGLTEFDGFLYGTIGGGTSNQGAVVKIDPSDGNEEVLYSFPGGKDGSRSGGTLVRVGSSLYGTSGGGRAGLGTVYKINPSNGAHRIIHTFTGGPDGGNPNLLTEIGGILYGTTAGQYPDNGAVFRLDPVSGQESVIHQFGSKQCLNCTALAGIGGTLYGTSYIGGSMGTGAILGIAPDTGVTTTLHEFAGLIESSSNAGLIDFEGTLYGTSSVGGPHSDGTVFRINPLTGAEKTLFSFSPRGSGYPLATLTAAHGKLYGASTGLTPRGDDSGALFAVDPNTGLATVIYRFTGSDDGKWPEGALLNVHGTLYGTTRSGGAGLYYGTIFKLDPATGVLTTIHSLNFSEGANPTAGLVEAGGALYGTASSGGGPWPSGTIFKVDPATGATSAAYQFTGRADGGFPRAPLINVGGMLYGTVPNSNVNLFQGNGSVFRFDPATGALTTLYSFTGGADGSAPTAPLLHVGNLLYGTTTTGGVAGAGTAFQLDLRTGQETTLYSFSGGSDGGRPVAGLTKVGTSLFGMTSAGGSSDAGTVFKLQR
jgi:uncharacterized repeat protein (TIGR03803 family)